MEIVLHTWLLFTEAAPWLVFGLVVAGLIKAFVPEQRMAGWLGGRGIWPVSKAALIGAPLPLCSCSVIPVAISLHRAGASRASTTAFLVSAPETGVDSVAASYALLGPFLTVVRPLAAVASAIITGLLVNLVPIAKRASVAVSSCGVKTTGETVSLVADCCRSSLPGVDDASAAGPTDSCCGSAPEPRPAAGGCSASTARRADNCCGTSSTASLDDETLVARFRHGLHYAITQIFSEFAPWLAIGLLIAGVTITVVPPAALAAYGSGLPAMLLLLAISVPLYVCATESTPIATAMLAAGVSPGAVLVFLMAGPATNVATIGALRTEFGNVFVAVYLASVGACAIAFGVLTNLSVRWLALTVVPPFHDATPLVSGWISLPCAAILLVLAIAPVRRYLVRYLAD